MSTHARVMASGERRRPVGDANRKTSQRARSEELGPLLRSSRLASGVGIKKAAPELGVTYTYLSKIENGVATPSAELLAKMAKYYGSDSDALFAVASRLPPDVARILSESRAEAVELLRKRFGRGSRRR